MDGDDRAHALLRSAQEQRPASLGEVARHGVKRLQHHRVELGLFVGMHHDVAHTMRDEVG